MIVRVLNCYWYIWCHKIIERLYNWLLFKALLLYQNKEEREKKKKKSKWQQSLELLASLSREAKQQRKVKLL